MIFNTITVQAVDMDSLSRNKKELEDEKYLDDEDDAFLECVEAFLDDDNPAYHNDTIPDDAELEEERMGNSPACDDLFRTENDNLFQDGQQFSEFLDENHDAQMITYDIEVNDGNFHSANFTLNSFTLHKCHKINIMHSRIISREAYCSWTKLVANFIKKKMVFSSLRRQRKTTGTRKTRVVLVMFQMGISLAPEALLNLTNILQVDLEKQR